jgi:hypothetical protein
MWTREANDILVDRWGIVVDTIGTIIREPGWRYKSGVGDIRFLDDTLLCKSNPSIIRKRGWEFGLFEIVYIREGRFLESPDEGNRRFSTSGFGLRFSGLAKILRTQSDRESGNTVLTFILNHLDVSYNSSKISTFETKHPLQNTRFHAVSVTVYK